MDHPTGLRRSAQPGPQPSGSRRSRVRPQHSCPVLGRHYADIAFGSREPQRLLAGCMDGSFAVLDAGSGRLLAKHRPHTKYCVRALWLPGCTHVLSCAWDSSLGIHRLSTGPGEPAESALKPQWHAQQAVC